MLTHKERVAFFSCIALFLVSAAAKTVIAVQEKSKLVPIPGGTYIEGIVGQPIALNPIISVNQPDQDMSALLYAPLGLLLQNTEVGDEGRLYTLKLQEGLKWSDGEPLTSDDVIFTVKTVQDPDARSPYAKSWQGVVAERVSELQVKLSLPTPYVFFSDTIARLPVIPRHVYGAIPAANLKLSSYNLEPVGSGPYRYERFSKRKDGFITKYEFVRNEHYAKEKPLIEKFVFAFYENEEALLKALTLREVQGWSSPHLPSSLSSLPHIVTEQLLSPNYYAIFFNSVNNAALKDKNLRQALSLSIDRVKIAQEVFDGYARPVSGPVLLKNDLSEITPKIDPLYRPEEARNLIAKVKNAADLEFSLIVPKSPIFEKIGQIVKDEWATIGLFKIHLIPLETDELFNNVVKTRNYEMLLFGNALENREDLFPFWHSSQRFYPGFNLSLFQNVETDKLLEVVRQTASEEDRKPHLEKLNTIIGREMPAVFLFSLPYFYLHTDRLHGFSSPSFISPKDRFAKAAEWYLSKVRVLQ